MNLQPWHSFPSLPSCGLFRFPKPTGSPYGAFGGSPTQCIDEMSVGCPEPGGVAFHDVGPQWRLDFEQRFDGSAEGPVMKQLGDYCSDTRVITLYVVAIRECAHHLKLRIGEASASALDPLDHNLAMMVFLHEVGHALHHWRADGYYRGASSEAKEQLAQKFTLTAIINQATKLELVFRELELMQPDRYSVEKGFRPSWENCREAFCCDPGVPRFEQPVDPDNRGGLRSLPSF